MTNSQLNFYVCPQCRYNLSLNSAELEDSEIKNGHLRCQHCDSSYPIVNFIPRFCELKNYADSFGLQWNRYRHVQVDKFNGFNFSRNRLFGATQWSRDLENVHILEAGSGAGRFTQILIETKAQVFSFDFSTAVDANFENFGRAQNLHLFQADMHKLPLQYQFFDKILCLGVLQHTPEPKKAFMSLIPYLKNGGEIVIDIYKKTLSSMLHWKYFIRPFIKHMGKEKLCKSITSIVPHLLPTAVFLRKFIGSVGARILPIANYSHLGISAELNREWSILDTFDMYAPEYDKPQTLNEVKSWFEEAKLQNIKVRYGPNGIIGRGIKK